MATTPEGKVKARVKALLDAKGKNLFYWMPVQSGYGRATLDFVGSYHGQFFAIETKAPGKKPTARQQLIIKEMEEAGGQVFTIWDTDGLRDLEVWLSFVP